MFLIDVRPRAAFKTFGEAPILGLLKPVLQAYGTAPDSYVAS